MNGALNRPLRAALLVLGMALVVLASTAHAQRYNFQTIAGNFNGDGGQANQANLGIPVGLAFDAAGNLYVAESQRHRIRMIGPDGSIRTVAGTGIPGDPYSKSARGASSRFDQPINFPLSLVFDSAGNLYFSDSGNNRVSKLSPQGRMTLVAGSGSRTYGGDGGSAVLAGMNRPYGLALDSAGNLYIADSQGHRIRKVTPGGTITTFAGNGIGTYAGDGGPATQASLFEPAALAFDASGNLYIADSRNNRVRMVAPGGTISTVVGTGVWGSSGDGGPATAAEIDTPYGVSFDASGRLFVSEYCKIRTVGADGIINEFVSDYSDCDDVMYPENVAFAANGDAYFADSQISRIYSMTGPHSGLVSIAGRGNFFGDGGPAVNATLSSVTGVTVAPDGEIYIADAYPNHRIRKITSDGKIVTVVGNGYADSFYLNYPMDAEVDVSGNLYIADRFNNRIRKIGSQGSFQTFAGNGTFGFAGDGGLATAAAMRRPQRMALDGNGNVFIADTGNHRIRKVNAAGIITTVAGNGTAAFSGDGGPALSASLSSPSGIAIDRAGNLYIADQNNYRVRMVTPGGTISTIAGNGINAVSGNGTPAINASIGWPRGVAFTANGELLIAAGALLKVSVNGLLSTVSDLKYPANDVALGTNGSIYVTSAGGRVLKGAPVVSFPVPPHRVMPGTKASR